MAKGDREILKADIDDGYTTIANLLLEALAMAKMTGVQKGICLFLIRRTYGWGQKEDAITLKEFAQACGTSPSYVSRQLKEIIKWNVIKRVSYKPGRTPVYTINTRVAQWDKGCTDVQGLYNSAIQGLYNRARVGFNNRARVEQGQTLDTPGSDAPPKESIKENIKKDTSPYGDDKITELDNQPDETTAEEQSKKKPKRKKKETSPEAKAVAKYLKERLAAAGVDHLPRDWHLKNYATAERMIKSGVDPGELLACIDWLFSDAYWCDKVTDLLVVERQYPKFKLQRSEPGGNTARGDPVGNLEQGECSKRGGIANGDANHKGLNAECDQAENLRNSKLFRKKLA